MKKTSVVFIIIILFVFLTTFNPANLKSNFKFFQIKEIEIQNTNYIDKDDLNSFFINNYYDTSLIKFKNPQILETINSFDIIESLEIKKIYPNKLKVYVKEKKPIAILIKGRKSSYLTENGELAKYFEHPILQNLPNIIGDLGNFFEIYKILLENNILISEVKSFYYFDIGRWDIILKDGKTIKLPPKNFETSIENFSEINNNENFNKYKIFDYRINDQLILN